MCSQYASMVQCFRFLNSETFFDDKALTVLLRVLCEDDKEYREKWWTEVRACRRRKQEPLGAADIHLFFRFPPSFLIILFPLRLDPTTSIVTVFHTQTEFEYMEFKAIVERVRAGLVEKGMVITIQTNDT